MTINILVIGAAEKGIFQINNEVIMWPFKKRKYGTCEWDGKSEPKLWVNYSRTRYSTVYHRYDDKDEKTEFYCIKCNAWKMKDEKIRKVNYKELFLCPKCHKKEGVAIKPEDKWIIWCLNCGYQMSEHHSRDKAVEEWENEK